MSWIIRLAFWRRKRRNDLTWDEIVAFLVGDERV